MSSHRLLSQRSIGVLALALLTLTVISQITAAAAAAAARHGNDIAIIAAHHHVVHCDLIALQYGTSHILLKR